MDSGKICIALCAGSCDDLARQMGSVDERADLIEIRFDCLEAPLRDVAAILNSARQPVIVTFRSHDQGGRRPITLDERVHFWRSLPDAELVDLEEDIARQYGGPAKRIVSYHDFNGGSSDLPAILESLSSASSDVIKIATHAADAVDAIDVWKLLETSRHPIIPIAMGEAGIWTRILGLSRGAFLTYAAPGTGRETAPGQITAADMIDVYRAKDLDRSTKVYGVIGDPVSSSLSPYIHNAAFKNDGMNAVFLPMLVKNVDAFFRRMVRSDTREVELNFGGFAVTMPHKRSVMAWLDEIDPAAEAIGAVNTIEVSGDKLLGYNTDAAGFMTPLKERLPDLTGARVALVGAGGAARACLYAMKSERAVTDIFVRDPLKWTDISSGTRVRAIADMDLRNYDILVNATPLGMKGEHEGDSPAIAEDLVGLRLVYDLVTSPAETALMKEAAKAGVSVVGGIEMLVAQAVLQYEIWTGSTAPRDIMKQAALGRIA